MFSFFKKEKHQRLEDQIYISRGVADLACIKEYNKLISENAEVVLICFFERSLTRLQAQITNAVILPAKTFTNDFANIATRSSIQQKKDPVFIFAEHHPHLYVEETIINEIETLCAGKNPSIRFYTSLDEPLMQQFGSQSIIDLMKKMGLKDDEAISHSMVTKSVANAQRKIAKKVTNQINAKSQEEWVTINLPK